MSKIPAETSEPDNLTQLIQQLRDEDEDLRAAAAQTIMFSSFGTEESSELLIALNDRLSRETDRDMQNVMLSAMDALSPAAPSGYKDLGSVQLPTQLLGTNQFEHNLLKRGSIFGPTGDGGS